MLSPHAAAPHPRSIKSRCREPSGTHPRSGCCRCFAPKSGSARRTYSILGARNIQSSLFTRNETLELESASVSPCLRGEDRLLRSPDVENNPHLIFIHW